MCEDVRDGPAVGLIDDEGVGVDEIPAELAGDDFSDGGFAGAHESDEDDVGGARQAVWSFFLNEIEDGRDEVGVVLKGGEVGGIGGGPTGGAEFGIADGFIGPAAFAVGVWGFGAWRREGEEVGEGVEDIALGGGGVVANVENAGEFLQDEMSEGGGGIIPMDLIDESADAVFGFDAGFAEEEVFQNERAARAVDACEARDGAAFGEGQVFGLAEEEAGFARGGGGV